MTIEPAEQAPKRKGSRIGATLKALIRTRVTTGLIVILPIYITFLVVRFVHAPRMRCEYVGLPSRSTPRLFTARSSQE